MEKPFIVFCGFTYYPPPGWYGYCGDAETLDNAKKIAIDTIKDCDFDWWQIVDLGKKEVVAGNGSGHTGLFGKVDAFVKTEA